jgi:hypothetical protein
MRYNLLEKQALAHRKVCQFVFASGADMAAVREAALAGMRRWCTKLHPPFVAAVICNQKPIPVEALGAASGAFPQRRGNSQEEILKTDYGHLTNYREVLYSFDVSEARIAGIVL